ncbi:hypothetical protein [Streptomyces fulvorobeus]|uniref:Clp R domain-containing protein n=1 Tax=Streptomyces fulvorobeus TaxID=284028 RepID=A0A7J0CCM1_9ACTN|nr:hypothetical protein [Streptomyces fulvorobeus]NYE43756.1 hypothetical protein [Streptomyces fulvorobeus]GFN00243.1 hypothetical protein Sfulv_50530 [Streptomyces fulvorobeus]
MGRTLGTGHILLALLEFEGGTGVLTGLGIEQGRGLHAHRRGGGGRGAAEAGARTRAGSVDGEPAVDEE